MVTDTFNHLLPEVRDIANLSISERINHIKKDIWIGYPIANNAIGKLQDLYNHPQRQRMPNLLIIGHTNNGKSMIVEKFCRNFKARVDTRKIAWDKFHDLGEQDYLVEMPIVSIQMPPLPDSRRFYLSILEKFKLASNSSYDKSNIGYLENHIITLFREYKVKMLIIDEIHNVLAGQNHKQREFLNLLRLIGNELKIPLVCVGTKDAYLAIRSDTQFENRFEPFVLPRWRAGREYESLLASMAAILPLKKSSNLNNPTISALILQKSEGILGEIVTLLRKASIQAVYTKETIDEMMFRMIDYHSPTERRQTFERSLAEAS